MARLTNFALLMQELDILPKTLAERLHADTSLISRWRTGSRRIMPGRHWAREIAECFLSEDERRGHPFIPRLLKAWSPDSHLCTRGDFVRALEAFLVAPGQSDPQYRLNTVKIIETLSRVCPPEV